MESGDKLSLAGRRALVTGAGRGIGQSIALALAQAGAEVVVSARTPGEIEAVAAQIRDSGQRGVAIPCDVTDPAQVERLAVTAMESLGGIDILVNNAGGGASHKFLNHPDEVWHCMLLLNLTSVYYVTKAFVPGMVERRWGRVITIASIISKIGGRYIAAYSAAKHGVLGLTRSLALELTPYHITVNAVCPGYMDTPMTQGTIDNIAARTDMSQAQARESLEKMSPQNRLITPAEVAAVVVFLAQESSYGITGQAINVDGGMVMG
ncbi:MAG: SDR family NAD(P)-dependent oxidoreductase [Anaerolineae bacterium]